MNDGIMVVLRQSTLQKMQDHLSVLGIVLVPGVVHGFASAGQSQRRNKLQFEPFRVEEVGERPMVVAGGFKTDTNREPKTVEESSERAEILSRVLHSNPLPAAPARSFDQSFVAILGYIDGYPHEPFRRTL